MTLRLSEALEAAISRLEEAQLHIAANEAKATLSAFFQWWTAGTWDENWLLTASLVDRLELIQLVRTAHGTTNNLLSIVRDQDLKKALDSIEAWHGRATRLVMTLESDLDP